MPKMMGSVWAPRMGSPEGTLTPFPFLSWVPSNPEGESGALVSKPSSTPTQNDLDLLLYSSLQASVSPAVEWALPTRHFSSL